MKIYVIGLKRRQDRRNIILEKFAEYGFTNFEIIDALDGQQLTYEDLSQSYSSRAACRKQRELTTGEVCTVLSHHIAYKKIIAGPDEYSIIIEDDCPITQELIDYCNSGTTPPPSLHVVLLGYFTSNIVGFLPQSHKYEIMDICSDTRVYFLNNPIAERYYKFDDQSTAIDLVHGTHCYCVSKRGCEQLMRLNLPVTVEADNVWNYHPEIELYGIRPQLADIGRDRGDSDLEMARRAQQATHQYDRKFILRRTGPRFGR